jgi:voltage-gated potassium channel
VDESAREVDPTWGGLPRGARALLRGPLTARRAARIIFLFSFAVTVVGGVLIHLVDPKEFDNLGESLWWSLQTVTTVGYGDVVPEQTGGRVIAAVVMLQGIALITVVAAAVTAALIEQARQRRQPAEDSDLATQLQRIEARLGAIEARLRPDRTEQ